MLGGNHSAGQNAGLAEAGAAMRSVAFWELPLVLGVSSVATAAHLADDGMPLPAVAVPALGGQTARAWARSVVAALAPLRDAEANESVAMTPVVQLDPCMGSDSLLRFSAFGAVLLGAQGLWWEGMGRCAPVGSAQFELVADINTHVSQWAEPLFMRKEEVQRGPWASEDADADFASAAGPAATLPAVPPFGPTDYVIDAAWSTSSLTLPPLRGAGGALVHAVAPGGSPSSVVQAMDAELIVVHFRNASADGKNGTGLCKSSKTVQGQDCITCEHDRLQATFLQDAFSTLPPAVADDNVLLVLSTELSLEAGGAPVRQLNVTLRPDVWTSHPIEPNAYQGFSTDCNLGWLGPFVPLRLPGGAAQALSYSLGPGLGTEAGSG